MKIAGLIAIVALIAAPGCRDRFQRVDSSENGFAHALECVEEMGDTAERAARECGLRSFAPGNNQYREGWEAGLECAVGQGGVAAEAAEACRTPS